jgi:hypothetical protein
MRHELLRTTTFAIALLGAAATWTAPTWAQNPGPAPSGQVPGPNATPPQASQLAPAANTPVQPAPGAMPGSETVPSSMSEKNAADDKLITTAYTFKNLTDDQRRAIYQIITSKRPAAAPPGATAAAEVGTEIPMAVPLSPIPAEVAAQVPQTNGYEFTLAGDKVLLVAPGLRVVVGVIAQ